MPRASTRYWMCFIIRFERLWYSIDIAYLFALYVSVFFMYAFRIVQCSLYDRIINKLCFLSIFFFMRTNDYCLTPRTAHFRFIVLITLRSLNHFVRPKFSKIIYSRRTVDNTMVRIMTYTSKKWFNFHGKHVHAQKWVKRSRDIIIHWNRIDKVNFFKVLPTRTYYSVGEYSENCRNTSARDYAMYNAIDFY